MTPTDQAREAAAKAYAESWQDDKPDRTLALSTIHNLLQDAHLRGQQHADARHAGELAELRERVANLEGDLQAASDRVIDVAFQLSSFETKSARESELRGEQGAIKAIND